jgi:hypothetical protein
MIREMLRSLEMSPAEWCARERQRMKTFNRSRAISRLQGSRATATRGMADARKAEHAGGPPQREDR